MPITDEMLSAYLDGELSPEDTKTVEQALAKDPDLARECEALRTANALVAEAAAAPDATPLPQGILDLIETDRRATAQSQQQAEAPLGEIISFQNARAERADRAQAKARSGKGAPLLSSTTPMWRQAVAVAACAVLAVGVILTMPGGERAQAPSWAQITLDAAGPVSPNTPLGLAVAEQVSGEVAAYESGALTVKPVMTFSTRDGAVCRHVEVIAGGQAANKLVCRDRGGWTVAATETGKAPAANSNDYSTASGDSAIDKAIDQVIASDPYTLDTERDLIGKGWAQ